MSVILEYVNQLKILCLSQGTAIIEDKKRLSVSTFLFSFFIYLWHYTYWSRRRIKQRIQIPVFGDQIRHFFHLSPYNDILRNLYYTFEDERLIGFYQYLRPGLMIRDPEIITKVCVSARQYFPDRTPFLGHSNDTLWNRNLFALQGHKWRIMRNTLSPGFSLIRMRVIFNKVNKSSLNFVQELRNRGPNVVTVELQDLFSRFTTDVLASVAFGIDINSLEKPDNVFYEKVKEALQSTNWWKFLRLKMTLIFPSMGRILGANIFNEDVSNFFRKIVKEAVSTRYEENTYRIDMLQLLMDARVPSLEEGADIKERVMLEEDDITSQALMFFLGGFETTTNCLCFIAYELAKNPNIQQKLYEELKNDWTTFHLLQYDRINSLEYLNMVVSETLRLWPPLLNLDRECSKPFIVDPVLPHERQFKIPRHTLIWIPVWCIHRDPKYWANPETFDPERFSKQNKENIKRGTYIPFGMGPRICLGSRFALMQVKNILYHLLLNFEIVPVKESKIPFVPLSYGFNLTSTDGFKFGLKKRRG